MAKHTPDFRTVTLTNANTNYTLSALLAAIDADIPLKVCQLGLQFDEGAGGDALMIGNPSTLSSTIFGRRLLATQTFDFGPVESNLIRTDQIALRSNGASHKVYVTLLTR